MECLADLPAEQAAFMADSQVPWGTDAASHAVFLSQPGAVAILMEEAAAG
jgi:hypothetical protein